MFSSKKLRQNAFPLANQWMLFDLLPFLEGKELLIALSVSKDFRNLIERCIIKYTKYQQGLFFPKIGETSIKTFFDFISEKKALIDGLFFQEDILKKLKRDTPFVLLKSDAITQLMLGLFLMFFVLASFRVLSDYKELEKFQKLYDLCEPLHLGNGIMKSPIIPRACIDSKGRAAWITSASGSRPEISGIDVAFRFIPSILFFALLFIRKEFFPRPEILNLGMFYDKLDSHADDLNFRRAVIKSSVEKLPVILTITYDSKEKIKDDSAAPSI